MQDRLSKLIDWFSNFFAHRKGLFPILGILFIAINFILQLLAPGWIAQTNLFLHLGVIFAIFGFLLAWAL